MRAYDFLAFLEEELGGDLMGGGPDRWRSRDYILGELLVLVSRGDPPKEYSFNTALIYVDLSAGRVHVGHDIYLDKSFEMSREDFANAVKDTIASTRSERHTLDTEEWTEIFPPGAVDEAMMALAEWRNSSDARRRITDVDLRLDLMRTTEGDRLRVMLRRGAGEE